MALSRRVTVLFKQPESGARLPPFAYLSAFLGEFAGQRQSGRQCGKAAEHPAGKVSQVFFGEEDRPERKPIRPPMINHGAA
jgi:hypothetical protein